MSITTINNRIIKSSIESFPDKDNWKIFELKNLERKSGKIQWAGASIIPSEGGIYAFSLQKNKLGKTQYKIKLDGPQKTVVNFQFSANDLPLIKNEQIVLYFGKTRNFNNRIKQHFTKTKTATQVLNGMVKMFEIDFNEARQMLLSYGTYYFLSLSGDENTANRDLIEMGLISKFSAPLNIKSER